MIEFAWLALGDAHATEECFVVRDFSLKELYLLELTLCEILLAGSRREGITRVRATVSSASCRRRAASAVAFEALDEWSSMNFLVLSLSRRRMHSENSSRFRRSCSRSCMRRSDLPSGNSSVSSGVTGPSASSSAGAFAPYPHRLSHSRASASRFRVCLSRLGLSLTEPFDLPFVILVTLLLDAGSSTKENSRFGRVLASFSAWL